MTAFTQWFSLRFADNPMAGATYLLSVLLEGPSGSVVWDYLERTGDKEYTKETLLKASQLILEDNNAS